jgi:hypothetical protein
MILCGTRLRKHEHTDLGHPLKGAAAGWSGMDRGIPPLACSKSLSGRPIVSEYQYFEFQAIDRPLSKKEMAELRSYSTRARITPASFVRDG